MEATLKNGETISLTVECRNAHSGQLDMAIRAHLNGVYVGALLYSVYEDEPSVQMIEVSPKHARRGIATAMAIHLQEQHPDIEIDWGYMTEDGAKLMASLDMIEKPNPDYEIARTRLDELNALLDNYEKRYGELASSGDRSAAMAFLKESDWGDKDFERDCLKETLENMKPTHRFLQIPEPASHPTP